MASETFNHYYLITSGVPGGTITLGAVNNPVGGTDLVETTADSDGINGQTEVENAILAFGSQRTLAGFTATGDPIVLVTTGPDTYYVFSNDGGLSGSISSSNTGTYLYCFAAGTGIATPEGEQAVETLCAGDLILTAQGQTTPVKWIGRQSVSTRFGPAERLMPVRFAAGSLGKGLPHADLTVTADHGMLVDGVICHAGALVNGTTITRVPLDEMGETYTVYHIETEEHAIILANGAPAETFIDNVSRRTFDNYAEFETLYGDVPEMEELPYPRAMSARQVPGRIVAKLAGKAVA
jgi:hypothetical protein